MLETFGTQFNAQVVVEENSITGLARIQLKRHNQPVGGHCSISPLEGLELITEFHVRCRSFRTTELPLRFTMYQGEMVIKWSALADFNVSLFNTEDLRFVRGSVHAVDQLGSKSIVNVDISVRPFTLPLNVSDFLNETKNIIEYGDFHRALLMLKMVASSIVDLPNETDKSQLTESVLDQMIAIDLVQIHFARMVIQSVMPLGEIQNMTSAVALKLSILIRKSCSAMLGFYIESPQAADEQLILGNINNTLQLMDRVIQPFKTIPFLSDYQVPLPVEYPFTEDYPEYEDFHPDVLFTIKNMLQATNNLHASLQDLSQLYFQIVQPEEDSTYIRTGSMTFINTAKDAGHIYLEDHNTLVSVESSSVGPMSVSAAIFQSNPYWWYPESIRPNSDVLMLFVSDHPTQSYSSLRLNNQGSHSINIFTKIQPLPEQAIHGMVAPQDDMPIYQIQVPFNALLTIHFKSFCAKLRVHLKANTRPKYYELVNQHFVISNASNELRWRNNGNSSAKLFVAITPDDPLSFVDSCDFSYSTAISVCRTWHNHAWSSTHCILGTNSTADQLHCICQPSQTVFMAQLYMAPNHLNLPRDLLLSLHNNQVLIVFVVSLGILFALLMYWAWRRDRLDVEKKAFIYLHVPNQSHPTHEYQITVATGLQKNAATSSHVYLSILGSLWTCYDLQLDRNIRFRRGTEDNFMIRTEKSFGNIESVDLWIECKGREPSWFCDWIRIRDIDKKEDWIFPVGQWFTTVIGSNPQTRHSANLTTEEDFHRKTNLFKLHFRHLLTDRFMWYSIWMPFPRSPFTRKQRLLVAMASLATSMMTNVMFFGQTTTDNVEDENELYGKLIIAFRVVSIIGQSMVISFVLGFALALLFKWTRRNQEHIDYQIKFRE